MCSLQIIREHNTTVTTCCAIGISETRRDWYVGEVTLVVITVMSCGVDDMVPGDMSMTRL